MKRRVRFAGWLFQRSWLARAAFLLTVWPFVYIADRWQGVEPPASFRRGWQWVRDGEFDYDPAIRTSDTPATVRRPDSR